MQVLARPELQSLTDRVQAELEAATKERTDLGLSTPNDFETHLTFYNAQLARAQAYKTGNATVMSIHAAPIALDYLKDGDSIRLQKVMEYFDLVRDFLGYPPEDAIFTVIQDPTAAIQQHEASLKPQTLQVYKQFLNEKGTSYKAYRDYTINNAQVVHQTIQDLLPKIQEAFADADLSVLRHELDHIDFFASPLCDAYDTIEMRATKLNRLVLQNKLVSQQCADANIDYLDAMAQVIPLLEVRALFFNYIPPGHWKKADFEDVKGKVISDFASRYVQSALPEQIVDPLVSVAWSEKQMNRQTSNYIFQKVNEQRNSPNAARYVVDLDQVNQELADRILEVELPKWKNIFSQNGQKAVEAIGHAFQHDPSRLSTANKAQTFDEYITLCRG